MNYDNEIEKNVRGMAAAVGLHEHLADQAVASAQSQTHQTWVGASEAKSVSFGPGTLTLPSGRTLRVHDLTLTEEPMPAQDVDVIDMRTMLSIETPSWIAKAIEMERQYQAKERMHAAIAEVCGGAQ